MKDKCHFWTFDPISHICTRHTAKAPENVKPDNTGHGKIRGPKFCNSMTTTELVDLKKETIYGHTDLPWEFTEHCVAKMNTSHFIMTGGRKHPMRTLIAQSHGNSELGLTLTRGPNLPYPRYQHACAHIRHKNGSNYVIVAGGHFATGYEENADDSTDILDVDKNIWFRGIIYIYSGDKQF